MGWLSLLGQPSKRYPCRISIIFHNVLLHYYHHISKNWRPILPCHISGLSHSVSAPSIGPDVSHPKFQNCSELHYRNNIFWFSCPDSEETIAVTEINNSSYESPNTQLFGVGGTRACGIIMEAPRLLLVKVHFLGKLGRGTPKWCHTLFCLLKYQIPHPKEVANGSRSDKNIIFLSAMNLYFRPTCAGWPCSTYLLHTAHAQRRVFCLKKWPLIFACNQAMKNVALLPLCTIIFWVLHHK